MNTAIEILQRLDVHTRMLHRIHQTLELLVSDQSHLDADVAELVSDTSAIEAEIAALKAANPAIDFSALDSAVSALNAVAAPEAPPAS